MTTELKVEKKSLTPVLTMTEELFFLKMQIKDRDDLVHRFTIIIGQLEEKLQEYEALVEAAEIPKKLRVQHLRNK